MTIELPRFRLRGGTRVLVIALLVVGAVAPIGGAQVAPDSIRRWTRGVQIGDLAGRDSALAGLSTVLVTDLPPDTRDALVVELNRVHAAMLSNTPLDLRGDEDLFGDYYMELVSIVASIRTPEAGLALAPAVGVSGGVARRVARLGDPAVDTLMALLNRHYEEVGVLTTLGLVWFWADSTGSPLSNRSRSRIVSAMTGIVGSDSVSSLLGLGSALREIRDPVFLPVATRLRDHAATLGIRGALTKRDMSTDVIPMLRALTNARPTRELAAGVARLITAVCGEKSNGRRMRACQSISNDFAQATRHLDNQETGPAHHTLESVAKKIDKAHTDGAFTPAERALLAGNITVLLERTAP